MLAAKKSGVQVNEFWIGMGPALWKRQYGETLYCLRLLPIGGACVMEGEADESNSARSFTRASRPRRFLILIAGVAMNFLAGFLILLCIPIPSGQVVTRQLDGFYEGFAFVGENGLLPGDEILSIDGYAVLQRRDVDAAIAQGAGDGVFDITVRRDGARVTVRGLALTPDVDLGEGRLGYGLRFRVADATIGVRVREAFFTAVNNARAIWDLLGQLVSGQAGVNQLAGPIGVIEMTAATARVSLSSLAYLMAFISINLGVMNLLPIPGLDGGRILFLLIESIRRKPLDPKWEGYVNIAGMLALMALMLYVSGNDVLRLLS